jgi:hypothetical protein
MKILCISTTKNECDVIESFVRHNARFCDHFCFIDESKDATREIVRKLQQEGFSIDMFAPNTSDYQQNVLITACLDAVGPSGAFDWAVFLDADEILPDVSRAQFEALLAKVPAQSAASMCWKTFVPLSLDYFSHADPLVANFRPRSAERSSFSKVLVPASLYAHVRVDLGNHRALLRAGGQPCPTVALPLSLAHFPVRSVEQIGLKNILACHTHSMKRNRVPGEGAHVYRTLEDLRRADFRPGYDMLRDLALSYADFGGAVAIYVDVAAPAVRALSQPLRHGALARPNVIAILDREIEYMSSKILKYRNANAAAVEALGASETAVGATAGAAAAH